MTKFIENDIVSGELLCEEFPQTYRVLILPLCYLFINFLLPKGLLFGDVNKPTEVNKYLICLENSVLGVDAFTHSHVRARTRIHRRIDIYTMGFEIFPQSKSLRRDLVIQMKCKRVT